MTDEPKTGNWRPGQKVPKTGTYKCIMCGPDGALMHGLNLAAGLAGIKPDGLASSQTKFTKFFQEGETFTSCPNCVALMRDAQAPGLDMTGWDLVSIEAAESVMTTAQTGDIDAWKRPLTRKAGWSEAVKSLMTAAQTGDVATLKRLLSQRAGLIDQLSGRAMTVRTKDGRREQPLHHAANGGQVTTALFLLDGGAPVDARNKWRQTPLHSAAQAGQAELASLLLDRGALIGAKDDDGDTPLHKAARSGRESMVKLLLQRGADLTARSKPGGVTPLVSALEGSHLGIADLLFAASGKRDLPGGEDSPLLQTAVLWNVDSVRWLIQHGASPNVTNKNEETPLHVVANSMLIVSAVMLQKNPAETLCVLLEAGADTRAKDAGGQTPLDIMRHAPSMLHHVAASIAQYGGSSADGIAFLQAYGPIVQLMQSILKTCVDCLAPQEFASEALVKATRRRVPFFMISSIVRAVMDAVRARHPASPVSEVVDQSTQAFDFICPQCGPLDREMIELAVSAKWAQDMNPGLKPMFAGPSVASVFSGWCPKCLSISVEVSFDPAKLSLGRG